MRIRVEYATEEIRHELNIPAAECCRDELLREICIGEIEKFPPTGVLSFCLDDRTRGSVPSSPPYCFEVEPTGQTMSLKWFEIARHTRGGVLSQEESGTLLTVLSA